MKGPSSASRVSCADLVRSFDWSASAIGPYEQWPERLKGYVSMILEMPSPAIIFWGPAQVQIYNDGYAAIMGPRHPRYFGAPYRECWPDTYPVIAPSMERVLRGEVVAVEDSLFELTRYGFIEEAYFTFTLSPLRDDHGEIAGIVQLVVERTQQVLRRRRHDTLHALEHMSLQETGLEPMLARLCDSPRDVPFALYYTLAEDGQPRFHAACGLSSEAIERARATAANVAPSLDTRDVVAADTATLIGPHTHTSTWGELTHQCCVLPVRRSPEDAARGVLVLGISPRLQLDEPYRAFARAIARTLATYIDEATARSAKTVLEQRADAARTAAELERSRLQSIFANAPVAITILAGPDYRIELANPRACDIWGRRLDEVLGRPMFEAMPETAGQGLEELLATVRSTGRPYIGTERLVRVRGQDGELRNAYFNFVYEPMKGASGGVESVLLVATDVSSSVAARQAAEQLARELEGARHDAVQARDVAQRASRAKDEFLAMLGHELRNPLAPIATALDLWRQQDPAGQFTRIRNVIERQARHLGVLVDDLLDVSRITTGKVELRREDIDLTKVIARAAETVAPLFEQRHHTLQINAASGLVVNGDSARLVQVFANLMTNAAKYTEPGGRITVDAVRDDGSVIVSVRDTGRGISPDMLPTIFDLFVQERQNLDRSMGGLGLGLSIVKNLVLLHGGSVGVESAGTDKGTTFTVRLPKAVGTDDAVTDVASPSEGVGHPGRVLIIDDNEDAAYMLGEVLQTLGYECTIAHDGFAGLDAARAASFDTALVDIGLPAMDGYEVARQLRQLSYGQELRIVAITGYGQQHDRMRALEAGFDDHLVKPVSVGVLDGLLREQAIA